MRETIPLRIRWRWNNFFQYFVTVVLDEPSFICIEWPMYRHAGQKVFTGGTKFVHVARKLHDS